MADYFTYFSVIISLPDEAAQDYAINLATQATEHRFTEEAPKDFPPALAGVIEDWAFETEAESSAGGYGVWLHSQEGGIDAVCAFIPHLLEKYDPTGRATFEWSNDCSKPRVDAYGGGAVVISVRRKRVTT